MEDQKPEQKPGFNARLALWLTLHVGTMGFFYACVGLVTVPLIWPVTMAVVQYISSGYLQLIFLPLIMVGQGILNALADKRHQEQEAANEARHQEQVDGQNRMIAHLETLMEKLCEKDGVCLDESDKEQ